MEDQIEYQLFISDAAAIQIKKQLISRGTPDAALRLGVKGGGCSGLSYVLQFEELNPTSKDLVLEINNIIVIVDRKSLVYLNQCTLDWEHSLLRQGFKFNNPQEQSKCGCGMSFST